MTTPRIRSAPFGCLLLVFLVIGGCSVPYILHNRALTRVGREYARITHPASSSALDIFSQVGIAAGGNGNHCDYLVGEIRESDEPAERIKAHYSAFSFPPLDPQNSQSATGEPVPLTVEFPGSPEDYWRATLGHSRCARASSREATQKDALCRILIGRRLRTQRRLEMPLTSPNHAMERTADRCALHF